MYLTSFASADILSKVTLLTDIGLAGYLLIRFCFLVSAVLSTRVINYIVFLSMLKNIITAQKVLSFSALIC